MHSIAYGVFILTGPDPDEKPDDGLQRIGNGNVLMNGKETSPIEDADIRNTGAVASEVSGDQKGSASRKQGWSFHLYN